MPLCALVLEPEAAELHYYSTIPKVINKSYLSADLTNPNSLILLLVPELTGIELA